MTEKQFISKDESIINVVTDELVNASSEEGAKFLVEWLNELSDKYAEQRKENYGLLDGVTFYKEENASLSERISDLECENEQLKQYIDEVEKDNERLEKITSQFKVGDIVNLNFANEVVDEQRKTIRELEKENEQLKKENNELKGSIINSLKKSRNVKCTCNPCVVEEVVIGMLMEGKK